MVMDGLCGFQHEEFNLGHKLERVLFEAIFLDWVFLAPILLLLH